MLIKIKVFPGEKKREVTKKAEDRFEARKKAEDRFEARVKAKPQEGQANREVVQLLADYFQVSEERVKLLRGTKRRNKTFEISNK